MLHTISLIFQINKKKIQHIYNTASPPVEHQNRITAYIKTHLLEFQNKEEDRLIPFQKHLPFEAENALMLFGHSYIDTSTNSLYIFVYDFNFCYNPKANPHKSITDLLLKKQFLEYCEKLPINTFSLDIIDVERELKTSYPKLAQALKNTTGLTPNQYHIHIRIDRVLQEFYFENTNVDNMVIKFGYNCSSTLYSDIKKQFKINSSLLDRYNYSK